MPGRLNNMTPALQPGEDLLPMGLTVKYLHQNLWLKQDCCYYVEKQPCVLQNLEEESPSGKSEGCQLNTQATHPAWYNRSTWWCPRHWETKIKLNLSGLESCPPELADSTYSLLAEHCAIFSLEPSELSCTHSTKHVVKVTNDFPFREWFRWMPLPLVKEICAHLWEMLQLGMICLSQSVWCNVVVLVWKKDGSQCFCIEFCHHNTWTKKDSYPLLRIQEALGNLFDTGHFLCLDLESGFWQIKMDNMLRQYTTFTLGNLGFFECGCMPFGLFNTPATFQKLMQNCLGELNLT